MPPASPQPDPADRELVTAYIKKNRAGEKPTRRETAAYQRYQKQVEDGQRWQFYASIPKKHWATLSGRQHKVLDEQAGRYGIPILGSSIDLAAVARWLHDFLARNAQKLKPDDDGLLQGDSDWAERYRRERALLVRLERREREGTLVDRERSHQCWTRVAGVILRCGEVLQRQYGPPALRLLNKALEDAQREVDSLFTDDDAAKPDPGNDQSGDPLVPGDGENP